MQNAQCRRQTIRNAQDITNSAILKSAFFTLHFAFRILHFAFRIPVAGASSNLPDVMPADHTPPVNRGLCGSCVHAQVIPSQKGTEFVRCGLSFSDARFPRYPRLPVVGCDGYQREADGGRDRAK
jgi:hypothetical protein